MLFLLFNPHFYLLLILFSLLFRIDYFYLFFNFLFWIILVKNLLLILLFLFDSLYYAKKEEEVFTFFDHLYEPRGACLWPFHLARAGKSIKRRRVIFSSQKALVAPCRANGYHEREDEIAN